MPRKFDRAKGRRESGPFVPIPFSVLRHPNYLALSHKAVKLLLDLASQLRMKADGPVNNGDLSIGWALMKERGWKSKQTLWNALRELEYYGFVYLTRQGSIHRPSLFCITWWATNDCNGKLDVSETATPSNLWKTVKKKYKQKNTIRTPIIVPTSPDNRTGKDHIESDYFHKTNNRPDVGTKIIDLVPR